LSKGDLMGSDTSSYLYSKLIRSIEIPFEISDESLFGFLK